MTNHFIEKEGICALCQKSSILRESHIIPKLVTDWMKETSGTGYIRRSGIPNLREQDGPKIPLLCQDCEQLFGVWEKRFAEDIFIPLHESPESRVSYGPWLEKFAVSVSWRIGTFFKNIGRFSHFSQKRIHATDECLRTWREFLLDLRPHPGRFEQHLLPLGAIACATDRDLPVNINRYLLRGADMTVAHAKSKEKAFVYAKMCRIVLIGFIEMSYPQRWKGSKLNSNGGSVGGHTHYQLPVGFLEFLKDRARNAARAYKSISQRQKDKIAKDYDKKDLDEIVKSESFRALHEDVLLFDEAAFEETDE